MDNVGTQLLLKMLEHVRRRVRRLSLLLGLGATTAVLAAMLLLLVSTDFLLNLHALPRLILSLAALCCVGYAIWQWVVVPVRAPLTFGDIAGRAEQAFPQYQDRLRSTVDILAGQDVPGSAMMKLRVVDETVDLTRKLDLNAVVLTQPAWTAGAIGAAALLMLGLIALFIGRHKTDIALHRLLDPFGDVAWPKQVVIDSAGDVPPRVAVGQSVNVAVRLSRGDKIGRQATVFYQYTDEDGQHPGPVQRELMRRDADGVYRASIDAVAPSESAMGTLKIWTESGDGRLDLSPVKVVQRLSIRRADLVIGPPPYAPTASTLRMNLLQDSAVVTPGATVTLTVTFNKPLDAKRPVNVQVVTEKAKPKFTWGLPDGGTIAAVVSCDQSFRFHLHATDTDGLTNSAAEEFEFIVSPDKSPSVTIESPEHNQDCTPDATVNLRALAEDDFGITGLKLVVDQTPKKARQETVLVEQGTPAAGVAWARVDSPTQLQRFRADYTWDLARPGQPHLQPGDVLEYAVAATDNFSLDGQTHPPVPSARRRINIISQDEFGKKVADEMSVIAEQAATAKSGEEMAGGQLAELMKRIDGKSVLDPADKQVIERLARQQHDASGQTAALAAKLAAIAARMQTNRSPDHALQDTAGGVADQLARTAGGAMKDAAARLNDASQTAPSSEASRAFEAARAKIAKAAAELQNAMDELSGNENLARSVQSAEALLEQQKALTAERAVAARSTAGKSLDELTPPQLASLQNLAKRQADLAAAVQKSLDEMASNSAKLSAADPAAAAAMMRASNTGNQQNVAGQQQAASQATLENRQNEAETAQKQAERGLAMMVQLLHEVQQQKQEAEARRSAQLQSRVAALIKLQAGHNLDNLTLPAHGSGVAPSPADRIDLYHLAGRDPATAPPSIDPATLADAQAQTAAETRDVAKAAAGDQGVSAAADPLATAADHMDRAVTHLRAAEYDAAYQPAQHDALADLLAAKQLIDAHKAASDQQQDEQKKATVKEAYAAIIQQQSMVNSETVAVDAAPRNDNGSIRRIDLLRRRRIELRQEAVIKDTQALDEPLKELGSIIYSFANQDLLRQMSQSDERLNQGDTGVATQALQKQILAQLDSLVDNLTVKKLKPATTQPGKGGGGGGGGGGEGQSAIPSEAEFRLLKALQMAVNGQTSALALLANPAKAEVDGVGKRQEDLRQLLDRLLRKSSKGKLRLQPTMDTNELLPEELGTEIRAPVVPPAGDEGADGTPKSTLADLNFLGKRMIRARERLLDRDDPGSVTQEIQNHIVDNLETLIQVSRQPDKPSQPPAPPTTQPSPKPKPKPQPDAGAVPNNSDSSGSSPKSKAGADANGMPGSKTMAANVDRPNARLWGDVTPRERQAVTESSGEKVLDKYKTMVDEYYQTMSKRSGDQ